MYRRVLLFPGWDLDPPSKKKEGRFKRQSGADLGCDGVPAAIFLHEL